MDTIIENPLLILNFIIATTVTLIAYQQYKLAKFNTRRDLYERRLPVFKSVMEFISKVVINADINLVDGFQLLKDTSEANFLFKSEIKDYINKVYNKGLEFSKTNKMMKALIDDNSKNKEYQEYCDKNHELLIWFSEQYKEAEKIFGKYLKLDKN